MAVFKCFVKMAIAVLPKNELLHLRHLCDWIVQERHQVYYKPLKIIKQSLTGPVKYDVISYYLLKRKHHGDMVPYLQFVIIFAGEIYQLPLPIPDMDYYLDGKEFEVTLFPYPTLSVDHVDKYGSVGCQVIDLTSPELVVGDELKMVMHFDELLNL
ncbi:hypothetical protein BI344_08025 [Chromobacterium sphagni]|uniref:Uncharacterized protein n=2 Tax=Chromobacterium sphagni TaxID=1903179 RepID=A0ABX3CDR1_9NEIS|nr:hypothetical protein BI344_08025 [Chromobacterium sphagni]